jgi:hypothetical protein
MDLGSFYDALFTVTDNLIMVAETIMLFTLADMFLARRVKGPAALLPAVVGCWGIQFLIYQTGMETGKLIISALFDFIFMLIYYHGNRYRSELLKKAFILFSYYAVMGTAQALSIAVVFWAFGGQAEDLRQRPELALGAYIISLLLLLICLLFCERFRRVEPASIDTQSWIKLMSVPAASMGYIWFFYPFERSSADNNTLMMVAGFSVLLLYMNLLVFYVYRSIAAASAATTRYEDLRRYSGHLDSLLRAEGRRLDTIHDYLHNLGAIAALIEGGQAGDAVNYIYKLETRIKKINVMKITGNREVDAVLSGKLPLLKEHGISCATEGVLPASLPFELLDICALLSNALDNALAACIRQQLTGEVIHLRVSFRNGFLRMQVQNPLDTEGKKKYGRSNAHGRGLAIMQEVVDKYEGVLSIDAEGGWFAISAILQQPLPHFETAPERKRSKL